MFCIEAIGTLFILDMIIPGNATWLYSMEIYPTSIRSIGVHMCSIMARVGAIGASYIGILVRITYVASNFKEC